MIRFFATHPTAANLLMLVFLVIGIMTAGTLRRETFPDFTVPEVEIRVPYPGATAQEVEDVVCRRVEDALDGIKYVKEIRSEARENIAIITVEMVDSGEFAVFKDDIETEIAAIDDFPDDVEDPVIKRLGTTELVLSLIVSGPISPRDLKAYCEDLKERLQRDPLVSTVNIRGFSDNQLRIELSANALMQYDLSVADVADVVGRQNVDLPAGAIETGEHEILVRFVEERRSPSELETLVIVGSHGGGEIRLGDLGTITDTFELEEDKVLVDGRRAGILVVEKTKTEDTIHVANVVKSIVENERIRHPQMTIDVTQDMSTLVNSRLNLIIKNAWQGGLLVFLAMWLFFNVRLSFWVVMSLPVSFLGALWFAEQIGMTINMITMIGILMALGLLMDDGIVIAENIATHSARGKPATQAAIDGVNEVKAGVFSSFITTVCVLGPLVTISGNIGKVLRVMPIILILVLAVSLVEAFLILPSHLAHSLTDKNSRDDNAVRRLIDRMIDICRERVLGSAIDVLLRWRYLWVGCVIAMLIGTLSMFAGGIVKFQAFPDLDGDVIDARLMMSQGTPLERTEEVVQQLTDALVDVNREFKSRQFGEQDLIKSVYVQFNKNIDAFETGPHVATVSVNLLEAEIRDGRIDEIVESWREKLVRPTDVDMMNFAEPIIGPEGRAIEIRLQGDDLEQLDVAATQFHSWLARFDGVLNLTDDLRRGKPEVRIRLREGTTGLGLDAATVARQVRAGFYGVTADEIQIGREAYEVDVRLRPEDQNSIADMEYFHFAIPGGKLVPLGSIAIADRTRGWSKIGRVDSRRTVTLLGDVDQRLVNTAQLFNQIERDYLPGFHETFPDIEVSFSGEVEQSATTLNSMMAAMIIGVIGVFVLLSFQFRSYTEPLIVMTAIPFALIGVIWGHWLMGIDLSMPSGLGFISLSGIVVNDSILLVLFLKMRREEGADIVEAAGQASRQRFRAIVITSLTTIAGLLPLLFERSLQAQVLIPLAASIAFGLLASTVLVLLVIPCLYAILGDFRLTADVAPHGENDS
ncbi:putative efflux pump membrane transporter TtgB [Symmachiella dynata]|uniref:Putative efflux pump membrane transporter TtgB n=1 Tax=Symmachiella dynata TaxID=2527995 RepID=A0A517ZQ79_9PLAN|nr:efflux RND transporter permease subunit [Symmachiella dynata]QDU44639.1 putative efflux pump membrane transporter TtgB [Symmachiella dynata]